MEYSSLTDFDSKLDALKNPNCPGEIIDKIVMDDDFPWGSEKAEVAKDLIASHNNTMPEQLKNLFKNAANEHQKSLILKNPNCPEKLKAVLKYTLEFKAWSGHSSEVDADEPTEWYERKFETLEDAKMTINGNDCIKWDDEDYVTISFNPDPRILDEDGNIISECKITDYKDNEFDWIDK